MERREQHIGDELKQVQCQFEALAGKTEEVANVADRVDMSGQVDQLQRMVQQVIDNNKPAAAEAASNIEGPSRSARERQI